MDLPGQKGKTDQLGCQISSLLLRMRERTSIRPIYAETFSVNLGLGPLLDDHVDKTMTVVLEYEAHCERKEQDMALVP